MSIPVVCITILNILRESNLRLRDCIIRENELIDYALELGHEVVAITDHESISNAIKVEKGANILEPIKSVLEEKLDDVHNNLKNHEDWNEEYQSLLSQERKYLYALNRIEQYETEQRISEFEEKLNDIESV